MVKEWSLNLVCYVFVFALDCVAFQVQSKNKVRMLADILKNLMKEL